MEYRIRELRKAKGLTQEELADRAGVSRITICCLENGTERNTSMGTLRKIANALETTPGQLFFDEAV